MLILSMETQELLRMAHEGSQGERGKELHEITEEQFLKDLYLFMRKRDTPIERIPHLGFKQIDLFVMFRTVGDLGGYHQVTAQQLWKQVYNRLGGNPRSTSAATCTRRHYEKLLLPYECHMKGILMSELPQHHAAHYATYSKDVDDGQRPAKRKLISIPLAQSPHNLQADPHRSVFSLPLHYAPYYHPSHAILSPYIPIPHSVLTPHTPPAPESQFAFHRPCLKLADSVMEPLERLRHLAEQHKTNSGLADALPLNLSVKASSRDTDRSPASSFAPPSSSKYPKFLNKPSPLYTPHPSREVRSNRRETEEDEADVGVAPYSYPETARETYVIDVKATTASGDATHHSAPTARADDGDKAMAREPSSPKTDFTTQPGEEREASPEARGLSLNHILPRDNGGKMEIQIPLSLFQNWLRLYGSGSTVNRAKQLHTPPTQEEHCGEANWSDTDILPTNPSFHMSPQQCGPAAEDLRLRKRNMPSPTAPIQTTGNHHNTSQNHFSSYKPLPSGGILKNASSHDVYPVDQQDCVKSNTSKQPNCWDAYDKETRASYMGVKTDSSPLTVQQDFTAAKSNGENSERSETGPSAVLMVNSSATSLLQLTNEEVMKLKKIISSS